MLDGNGCVCPQHAESQRVRLPHRAPRRACAVFGNVIDPAGALRVTSTPGVVIDLYIENTTSYTPGNSYGNFIKGNTFGSIRLKGPGTNGETSSVRLTFTFKRRDTNAEVTIPWMQFTLFDFDQNPNDGDRGQEVAPPQPPCPRPRPSPSPLPLASRPAPPTLRIAPTDPRSRVAWPESQCAIAMGFEDYAVSSGPGVVSAINTTVNTVYINNNNDINSGARSSPQAASPHDAAVVCSRRPPASLHREILLVGRGQLRRQLERPNEPG